MMKDYSLSHTPEPVARRAGRSRLGKHRAEFLFRVFAFIVVSIGAVTMLVPFLWMLITSLKNPGEIFLYPPRWIPSQLRWQNYQEALTSLPFGRWYLNSIYVTLMSTLGDVVMASLVGYAFARLRARARNVLFMLLISTMLLPEQVTMIPVFLIFKTLGAVDTFTPLILPSWLGGGAFNIFLCRQFFRTVPAELSDAARIDGCNEFGIYWRIIAPLSRPVLATVALFDFLANWNDFQGPLIYLQDASKYTLSLGLQAFGGYYSHSLEPAMMMAAASIVVLPAIVVFFLAQRTFIQGVSLTGIKG